MKASPLAAFNKRFSSLTYFLKSSWSNRFSVALMIQYKDSKHILRKCEITSLAYSVVAFPPKNYFILVGAPLFLDNFCPPTSNFVAFCFTSSQNRWQFLSVLIFLSITTVYFAIIWASAAHRSLACSDVLRLSLCALRDLVPYVQF